jgi:GntR family transcriptional repressor for pyruvate dehydrogenase complex
MKKPDRASLVDKVAVKRVRVSDRVLDALIRDVREGKLRAGDRLPTEVQIAKTLGVGRSSVREAISALEMAGIVEVSPRRGTALAHGVANTLTQELSAEITRNLIRDFYELRATIESEAAGRAATLANEEQLRSIQLAHQKVLEKIDANKSWFDANTDFHLAVARASGNVAFVYALRAILKSYRGVRETINRLSSTPVEDIRDHTEILEAIEARDPQRAAAAMDRHLRATIRRLDDETVP